MTRFGMVHGRFQPFHLEQLQYILNALTRCHHCVIGVTNPEPSEFKEEATSAHRHLTESNPFSYFQRVEMIRSSLIDAKIDPTRLSFVPFHIFNSSKWLYYLPRPDIVIQYVRVFSAWEEKKMSLFRAYGFEVEVIDRGMVKKIEATQVRRLMQTGGDWKRLVPQGTARVIEMIQGGLL
jgi:nicotinamide mononucleotide adenylyltransferase